MKICLPDAYRGAYQNWVISTPVGWKSYTPEPGRLACNGFAPPRCNQWYPSEMKKYEFLYTATYIVRGDNLYICTGGIRAYDAQR